MSMWAAIAGTACSGLCPTADQPGHVACLAHLPVVCVTASSDRVISGLPWECWGTTHEDMSPVVAWGLCLAWSGCMWAAHSAAMWLRGCPATACPRTAVPQPALVLWVKHPVALLCPQKAALFKPHVLPLRHGRTSTLPGLLWSLWPVCHGLDLPCF